MISSELFVQANAVWMCVRRDVKFCVCSHSCALCRRISIFRSQWMAPLLSVLPDVSLQPVVSVCSNMFFHQLSGHDVMQDPCRIRSHSAPIYADKHCKATRSELAAMPRAEKRSPSRASSADAGADWGRASASRSRSKSVPRVQQPAWMETTDQRLSAAAATAESAAEQGGDDLKALYVMKPKDVFVAASSQPQTTLSETATAQAALSSQPLQSHHVTALHLHRMTGGGQKLPSTEPGPIATSLNPARHAMMINGRPVVALRSVKAAEFSSIRHVAILGGPGFPSTWSAVVF